MLQSVRTRADTVQYQAGRSPVITRPEGRLRLRRVTECDFSQVDRITTNFAPVQAIDTSAKPVYAIDKMFFSAS
jgi:hypothetical protein